MNDDEWPHRPVPPDEPGTVRGGIETGYAAALRARPLEVRAEPAGSVVARDPEHERRVGRAARTEDPQRDGAPPTRGRRSGAATPAAKRSAPAARRAKRAQPPAKPEPKPTPGPDETDVTKAQGARTPKGTRRRLARTAAGTRRAHDADATARPGRPAATPDPVAPPATKPKRGNAATPPTAARASGTSRPRPRPPPELEDAGLDADTRNRIRAKLLAWRAELRGVSVGYHPDGEIRGPEDAEQGAREAERSRAVVLDARKRRRLEEVEAALVRLDEPEFGICVDTGDPIGAERLLAWPLATRSVEAEARRERLRGIGR